MVDVLDKTGKKISEIKLTDGVFGARVRKGLLYEVVKMQQAAKRSGTASTKTRGEIKGSNAKPWRQKGTGRARAGTKKSPIWRSGGVVFGPRPRDYSYNMPKKAVKEALKSAILYKINENKLKVVDAFDIAEAKTKLASAAFNQMNIVNALVVTEGVDDKMRLAVRNLKGFKWIHSGAVNVYDILRYDDLLITKAAFEKLQTRVG